MASTVARTPVRTPLRRRFRIWRQRFLPVTVWLGAIALLLVLSQRQQSGMAVLPGVVEVNEVTVAPLADGMVGGITVDVLDVVAGDQVVALMDDTLIRGELITAQAELGRLRATLRDEKRRIAQRKGDQDTNMRRFALDLEEARLEHLERWARQESDKVTLRRLEILAERQRALVDDGVFDELTCEQTELECEALRRRVEESEAVLQEAATQITLAEARLAEYHETAEGIQNDAAMAPVVEAIAVQQARIQGITERMARLVLRAPIGGRVARILHRPGETVAMGAPLMTITDPHARRIIAYVDENTAVDIKVGDEVEVFTRTRPDHAVIAKVLKVGPRVEPFPEHLQRNAMVTQWGHPVLLGELPEGAFLPGQSVMIRYTPNRPFPFLNSLL